MLNQAHFFCLYLISSLMNEGHYNWSKQEQLALDKVLAVLKLTIVSFNEFYRYWRCPGHSFFVVPFWTKHIAVLQKNEQETNCFAYKILIRNPVWKIVSVIGSSEIASGKLFTIPGKTSLRISIIISRKNLNHLIGHSIHSYRAFLLRKWPSYRRGSLVGG